MLTTGQRIKQFRKSRHLTQADFAEYLDVSVRAVSYWECDRAFPTGNTMTKIVDVFGISALAYIFDSRRGDDLDER